MKKWQAILAVLVIFGTGVVTGLLAEQLYRANFRADPSNGKASGGPPPWFSARMDLLKKMEREFELTADQRVKIEAIILNSQQRMRAVWEQVSPKARDETRRMRESIRGELTPPQREKFEEILNRSNRRPSDGKSREDSRRKDGNAGSQSPGDSRRSGDSSPPQPKQ